MASIEEAYNTMLTTTSVLRRGATVCSLIFLLVVVRVVNSFHKDLAIVNLVGHRTTEQLADS